MGADTKANTRELVRAPGGLLERLQRGVALEALGESSSSFGTEAVPRETASMGAGGGAEECQWALTRKRTLKGGFERQSAYSSTSNVELPLIPSARAAPPSGPRSFSRRLRAWERMRVLRSVNGR